MALHQLPQSTVRLIGSSQVITSVSSAVKELVENSLDAGATTVDVRLENHGLDRIEVRDNGSGVQREDTRFMAKSHYTSKLEHTDDLQRLETYGFRGEALGSLCTVSEVTITTKTEDNDVSTAYILSHTGDVTSTKPSHLGQGTTVMANHLFKNLPVRKQFYNTAKKKREEVKKVEDLITSYSIVCNDVRFTLRHNKELLWQSSAEPCSKDVLLKVFGAETMRCMRHIIKQNLDSGVCVEMYLPQPNCEVLQCSRSSNDRFFSYVNRRPVSVKNIEKKVRCAFNDAVKSDTNRTPLAFLSVTVQLDQLDVNLEPNKTIVMLHNQEEIDGLVEEILSEVYGSAKEPNPAKNIDEQDSVGQADTIQAENATSVPIPDEQQTVVDRTNPNEQHAQWARQQPSAGDSSSACLPPAAVSDLLEDEFLTPLSEATQLQADATDVKTTGSDSVPDAHLDAVVDATGDHLSPIEKTKRPIDSSESEPTRQSETTLPRKEKLSDISLAYGAIACNYRRNTDSCLDDDVQEIRSGPKAGGTDNDGHASESEGGVTASQWSKGVAVQTASGPLQPVQLLIPGASLPVQQPSLTQCTPTRKSEKLKISKLQSPAQCTLYDVVNQQTVKRPTTSYIFFSKEIRPQVLKDNPGASFQEIAKLIGQKWNALSEEDKLKYEQLMTKDVERYRDQVYSRGTNAQPTKRRRTLEERSPTTNGVSRRRSNAELRARRVAVPVPFSLNQLTQVYSKGLHQTELPMIATRGEAPQLIGRLKSCGLWVAMSADDVMVCDPIRAQEMIIYCRLLAHHRMSTQPAERPICLNPSVVGGLDNWRVLQRLARSRGVPPDPFSYISDPRVERSGFTIRCAKSQGSDDRLEISALCEKHTTRDLVQVLDCIRDNSDVSPENARPDKVKTFLQAEASRMARKLPEFQDRLEVKDILKQLSDVVAGELHVMKCFHERPVALSVCKTKDINSQLSQTTQTLNVTSDVHVPPPCDISTPDVNENRDLSAQGEGQMANFDIESSFDLNTQPT